MQTQLLFSSSTVLRFVSDVRPLHVRRNVYQLQALQPGPYLLPRIRLKLALQLSLVTRVASARPFGYSIGPSYARASYFLVCPCRQRGLRLRDSRNTQTVFNGMPPCMFEARVEAETHSSHRQTISMQCNVTPSKIALIPSHNVKTQCTGVSCCAGQHCIRVCS